MSRYTETEHEAVLKETDFWLEKEPETGREWYVYGRFLNRIKEHKTALLAYETALQKGYKAGAFRAGQLLFAAIQYLPEYLKEKYGSLPYDREEEYFRIFLRSCAGREELPAENKTMLGVCYAYGLGTEEDKKAAAALLEEAAGAEENEAVLELGRAVRDGRLGYQADREKAHKLFVKAYELHHEMAIFEDFYSFWGEPESFWRYPYRRDIQEAYSYLLGQYMRIAHRGCPYARTVLEKLYDHGFPGDNEKQREQFREKKKYIVKDRIDTVVYFPWEKEGIAYTKNCLYAREQNM